MLFRSIKEVTQLAKIHNKQLLIVPAFRESTDDRSIFKLSLYDIMAEELRANFGTENYLLEKSTRANHMSKENNEIVASKIADLINNKIDTVSLTDFKFEKYTNASLYWHTN